ncbi:MAG: CHASE2 domain-containing protein [Betaproteobacteria bacterium]|nr:CHASE2 domain-containing protein [Betaproteobacteria bacterium]
MKKLDFWKADRFIGAVVSVFFLFAGGSDLLQGLERKAYDLGVQASSRAPSDRIAIIAIDDQSIANLGRWPWPREIQAKMTDLLAGAKVKVIANSALFFEAQVDPGLIYVQKLLEVYNRLVQPAPPPDPANPAPEMPATSPSPELVQMGALLAEAADKLDNDRKFADSMARAKNVVLGMVFAPGQPVGKPDKPLPDYVVRNNLARVRDPGGAVASGLTPNPTVSVQIPVAAIGQHAAGIGHLNTGIDVDGGVRLEPLVLGYYDQFYPALSLLIAARSLNLEPKDIQINLGEGVLLGKLRIGTDPFLQMNTYFYKDREGRPAFQVDSFYDVYTGKIPASKYQDKIVLIGATAAGVGSTQVTPVSPAMAPVLTLAHSVSSILKEDFFVVPSWATWAERGVFLLIAAYLIGLLPRLKAGMAAVATAALLVVLVGTHFGLMTGQAVWLQLMVPASLLLVGHGLLTTKRYLVTEKGKEKSEAESADLNRNLGLAFQGQGQLDMAFDKFRRLPMDDGVMDLLYNLALDFERKRQFNKAEAVYRHMADYNPKFKDLDQKLTRAKAMSETVMLGGGGAAAIGGTVILPGGGVEKPMLGRYQVEKELGKGAMGVVYLGKDPKIGRTVAIKTMALAQEFEAEELAEVKERFFREAQTAGRLSHPNIVAIFDAGDEHDLAYIAMEFLKGKDLVPYSKAGNLLPLPKVLSVIARVADALDYAHQQNVVHRDIKPANVMWEPESDTLKVTDFGIARITDSSKTKTGMVLGTPSYMSPEQLAGKKVEGRSDLFSLGVTLYQLCCGKLPFEGDSMAQLMFKIASEPPTDILSIRPDLPPCLVAVVNKALAKKVEERFATGAEMAQAIRQCAATLQPVT